MFELPLHDVPRHILDLRQTLLTTIGASADEENQVLVATKTKIAGLVPNFFPPLTFAPSVLPHDERYALLSLTVKSAVSRWIRQTFVSRLPRYNGSNFPYGNTDRRVISSSKTPCTLITLEQFQTIRSILEEIEEFAILADILSILSCEGFGSLLTATADTINYYFDIFEAMGATDELFRSLYQRFGRFHGQDIIEKDFLDSLIDLGCRLRSTDREVGRLRKEILAYVPKLSASACSPISDHMVEASQPAGPIFPDEINQIVTSGTSMDKQTMTRIFDFVVDHLNKVTSDCGQFPSRLVHTLALLRGFSQKTFDALMNNWLRVLLQSDVRPKLSVILPGLVCSKVISLKAILKVIAHLLYPGQQIGHNAVLALETFEWIIEIMVKPMTITEIRQYRLLNQFHRLVKSSPALVMTILRTVFEACGNGQKSIQTWARMQSQCHATRDLVRSVLPLQPEVAKNKSFALSAHFTDPELLQAVGGIIYVDDEEKSLKLNLRSKIRRLLENVSEFNVPLARLELKTILASTDESPESTDHILSDVFIEFVLASECGRNNTWKCLISEVSVGQASSIREKAESECLSEVLKDAELEPTRRSSITGFLSIVESVAFSIADAESSPLVQLISQYFADLSSDQQCDIDWQADKSTSTQMYFRLDVLLRLLVIHQSSLQNTRYPQNSICQLLIALSLLLLHLSLDFHSELRNRIFDVLNLLSDSITDDTRQRCIRILREHHRTVDPRLQFVFGYCQSVQSEWLQLATSTSFPCSDTLVKEALATTMQPYILRRWEIMQDATPVAMGNDTSLSLTLFGAKKSVL